MQVNIGVDTIAPKVQISLPAANKVNITVNDPSDGGSGLWKPAALRPLPVMNPAIQQNSTVPAVLYRIFTKAAYAANPSAYEFDDLCNLGMSDNGNYYKFGELPSATATATKTLSITTSGIKNTFATTTNMIAYCVQDNA